ncbi:hypothetical protein PTTG_26374 [Puccinia triticina 1-1 BBBD Race 1]|uniref:Uncharacterized protein n=1 Tax=Puccinia triticina (isolate 1-1 / race 1 (BBBD)) TaxID=630390 RepID=A0A180GUD8_PUCT1|nr:hypothetical protein PTTG_26374 [Puccinia triticina 1-1 BBBD Race 1]
MSVWGKVTQAKTPEIYIKQLDALKKHLSSFPAVLEYIQSTILLLKEKFIVAWACDLLSVFKSLALAVETQINQVHNSIGQDTVKTLVNVPKSFIPLLGNISTFALRECLMQFDRLNDFDRSKPCLHTVSIGLGIPCPHIMAKIFKRGDSLALKDFHFQWHLKYNPEITKSDTPELDLDEEMKLIMVLLLHKQPSKLVDLIDQTLQKKTVSTSLCTLHSDCANKGTSAFMWSYNGSLA